MILTQACWMENGNLPPSYRKSSCPDFGVNILPHCANHSLNKRYTVFSILGVSECDSAAVSAAISMQRGAVRPLVREVVAVRVPW
ncbi:hypothetical protein J6590_069280 [Homalodisca vitripennis]|nr:hypothetical protein J6590_095663 [Homalodisca vitripennis]KAG8320419.1 hypothetical protein J6590_069280 [Homalodisca vitripennis]